MPDAPSAPNPIQGFLSAKNPADAIKFLQNSGLNKDQMYDLRQKLKLDDIAPGDFLLADNAWNAAEALKKMDPKDFGKFKAQFGKRFNELNKTNSQQPVEKNLGRALGSALGFQARAEKPKPAETKPADKAPEGAQQQPQASTVRQTPVTQTTEATGIAQQSPVQATAPVMRPQVQTGAGAAVTPRPARTGAVSHPTQTPRAMGSRPQRGGGQRMAGGGGQTGQQTRPLNQNLGRASTTGRRRIEQPGSQAPSAQAAISTKATQRTTPAEFTPGQTQIQSQTQIITPQVSGETPKISISVPSAPAVEIAPQQNAIIRRSKREDFQIPTAIEAQEPEREPEQAEIALVPGQEAPEEVEAPRAMPPGTPINIKPGATLPIERMVNLGAQQYRARRGASPQDQRSQVLGERSPGQSSPVLPQFEAPLEKTAYTSGPSEMDIETGKGGGAVESDLEAIQRMQSEQQKARRTQMQATGQAAVGLGVDEFEIPGERELETQGVGLIEPEEEAEEEGFEEQEEDMTTKGKFERFASQMMQARAQYDSQEAAKASATSHAASLRRTQKSLQYFWRMINGSSALSFWGISFAVITANLQMINKYTFQVKWLPPTEIYEDLIIIVMDMVIALALGLIIAILVTIITLAAMMVQKVAGSLF